MGDIFNEDFQDFIKAFNQNDVSYILIGGYAVNFHGYHRNTADMDLFVEVSVENYEAIQQAFADFGMPTFDMTKDNFLNTIDFDVFSFGRPPVRIEILTKINGITFETAMSHTLEGTIDDIPVRVLNRQGLLKTKKLAGRYKDLDDIQVLNLQEEE